VLRLRLHQVWNRQRRDEELLDVEDVAAGYETRQRWNDTADWVWSAKPTHEAIVSSEDFARAQAEAAAHAHGPTVRKARSARRPYPLSGLVRCGICSRRMQGQHNHGTTYYRCRFPSEYAQE
jgi:site-specific DNA recombinase